MRKRTVSAFLALCAAAGAALSATAPAARDPYLDYSGRDDALSGGVKMLPVQTPQGTFNVWTKRVGNNPRIKVLLLHGGPGVTHEYFEAFDSYLPAAGFEYYYYDQLGSDYSDQPNDATLWELARFVEEVEQVRKGARSRARELLSAGHSWGGLLAMEYALKYQDASQGTHHLQHDGEHPGLQRLRPRTCSCRPWTRRSLAQIKRFEAAEGLPRTRATWSC